MRVPRPRKTHAGSPSFWILDDFHGWEHRRSEDELVGSETGVHRLYATFLSRNDPPLMPEAGCVYVASNAQILDTRTTRRRHSHTVALCSGLNQSAAAVFRTAATCWVVESNKNHTAHPLFSIKTRCFCVSDSGHSSLSDCDEFRLGDCVFELCTSSMLLRHEALVAPWGLVTDRGVFSVSKCEGVHVNVI